MKKIFLSASALSVYRDCPRCFWIEKNAKVKRPRGIFPSLPGGMDGIIKTRFDKLRACGTDVIKNGGKLFTDQAKLDYWRAWQNWSKTDLVYETDRARIAAFLDDLLIEADGSASPFDYKTRGSVMKGDPADYARTYYQSQMDIYALCLQENGFTLSGFAYLYFMSPASVLLELDEIKFDITVAKIEVYPEKAIELIDAAVDCLEGKVPNPSPDCEYCAYTLARKNAFETEKPAAKKD